MGLYQDHVLPYLIHISMRQETFAAYRRRVVAVAEGRVLEIGIGSGLNLPFYGPNLLQVIGLDPSRRLLSIAQHRNPRTGVPTEFLEGSAQALPLSNESVDTVVTAWTLCSIADVDGALGEIRRVLKMDGRLLFVEHSRSPDANVSRWQDRLTPVWKRIAGGCHLNRPISALLEGSGFRIQQMSTGYMRGPKAMTFMYEGSARLR